MMSHELIKDKISKYDTIIIHRHERPDLDAIGSQVGLKEAILATYPNKTVYVVGDSSRFDHIAVMDEISDEIYYEALVIIVDVAIKRMISDHRYELAKEVIIIDHHTNQADVDGAYSFIDESYEAAAAYIADILLELNFRQSPRGADMLLSGIITDSGRFQFLKNGERLFNIASRLMAQGANPVALYDWLYTEDINSKMMKIQFQSRMVIDGGVAYLKNTKEIVDNYPDVDVFTISRGTVNLMAGIDGVPIWANFTYDKERNVILGEFRSRGITIVDIAKKYGGGGHNNACGATLESWEQTDLVIADFKKLLQKESE